jgi:hypothetical protein
MNARFITDAGAPLACRDEDGETVVNLSRYAVWGDLGRGKPEVVECHDDVQYLLTKYGELLPVFTMDDLKERK